MRSEGRQEKGGFSREKKRHTRGGVSKEGGVSRGGGVNREEVGSVRSNTGRVMARRDGKSQQGGGMERSGEWCVVKKRGPVQGAWSSEVRSEQRGTW